MLTDARRFRQRGQFVTRLGVRQANALIRNGTAQGGMIPKLQTAIDAVKNGVGATAILDGRVPNAICWNCSPPWEPARWLNNDPPE